MKLFILIVCSLLTLQINPSMYFDINNNEINIVKDQLITALFANMTPFSIPNITYQYVTLKNMTLRLTGFNPNALNISFKEGTSNILIQGKNVGFIALGNVSVDLGNVSTGINITAVKMGANITVTLGLDAAMKPTAVVSNLTIQINPDDLQVIFSGNMASWIVSLVIAAIKAFFMSSIITEIQNAIPPPLNVAMAAILSKVPTNITLGNVEILDGLTAAPFVSGGNFIFPMITQIKDETPLPFTPPMIPQFDTSCSKGVQIIMGDYIFNDIVYMLYSVGAMRVNINTKIFGLPFNFDCGLTQFPVITFNNSISTSLSGRCGFKLGWFSLGFLSSATLAVNSQIRNNTISFSVDTISIDSLKADITGTPDMKFLINYLNPMFSKLVSTINDYLSNNTLALPSIPGIEFSDTEESIKQGYMSLCSIIKIDMPTARSE